MSVWLVYVSPIAVAITAALLSSFLTYRFTYKRTKMERLWDLKLNSYTEIFTLIAEIKFILNRWMDLLLGIRAITKEENNELTEKYNAVLKKITTVADEEILFISNEAQENLNESIKQFLNYTNRDIYKEYEGRWLIMNEVQKILKNVAERDLEINKK